jgi:hypothetical protein
MAMGPGQTAIAAHPPGGYYCGGEDQGVESERRPRGAEEQRSRRGRRAFFTWFFALFGVGAAMLALLLIGSGRLAWSSPVGIALLALSAAGVVCLAIALIGLFRARERLPKPGSRR